MEVPEKHLETLVHLGLTSCQAKVYLATIKNGITSAKKISEVTKIARPYVYRVITGLEKLGLIEKSIDKHSVIKAIPLEVGISFLVKCKKQETLSITKKAERLIRDFKKNANERIDQDYAPQFIWLSKKEPYIRKRREEIYNAQTSIDFVTSWKRLPLTAYTFGENAEEALKRKVKIRVIMEKPPKEHSLPMTIQKFKDYPNYDLRYSPNPPLAVIGIFDRKRIIFDAASSAGLAECPALWSNNTSLLAAMLDYFENSWIRALKE
ncbi:MAG: hypothetical protein JSW14_00215 [Candidatus Bathyarchaeum sp.]|nr:MAG: hypothetical protein JSW14_00215 [Candidatus Bathyarchaeum sp.]